MKLKNAHKAYSGEVRFYQHDSITTKTTMGFSLFVPPGEIKGSLLWLSGLTCTEENFISKACALSSLADLGIFLICPDSSPRGLELPNEHQSWDFGSGASFYVNATTDGYKEHYLMQDYLMEELLPLVEQSFSLPNKMSISGHSMGGHGALTLGLKHADRFKSISAFSPIVNPINCPWGQKAFLGYLGEDRACWSLNDSCELVKAGYFHPNPILVTQGTSDQFLEEQLNTEALLNACRGSKQALEVDYAKGYDHSYFFISSFIEKHLSFHASFLS